MTFCRPFLLVCLILPPVLAAPGAADEPDHDTVLRAYLEVWNSGELDRLDGLVTQDYRRHAGPDESCSSRQELKTLIGKTRTIYKHLRLTIDDQMTEGRKGALRGSFYGVHAEVDRVAEFPLMSMYRFEDGRIAEEWILGNNFLVLVGLGFQLTPPGFEVIEAPGQEPDPEGGR